MPNSRCQNGIDPPQSSFPQSWIHIPVAPGPCSQGCSRTFQSPCPASSQLLQTREPSSLCLLLLLFLELPRSGGRAQLGLSVPEKSTEKWEWLVAAPSQAVCQGGFGFISQARHPGNGPKACLGREEVLVLLWTPGLTLEGLFSFQAALQHSHKKGFAMQRKTSHPPRGSVWAGSGAGSSCAPVPGLQAPAPAPGHVLAHPWLWQPHSSRLDHGDPLGTMPRGQSSAL